MMKRSVFLLALTLAFAAEPLSAGAAPPPPSAATRNLDAHPVFVGEPTGSRPNFVGEDNVIILPWSGLQMSGSSRYWQDSLSEDQRIWIAPDLAAEMTSTDFLKNRDPVMEAIRAYRANGRAASAGR